jgi:hypothetical protein
MAKRALSFRHKTLMHWRSRLGKAAFEHIKTMFTLENQARALTELYRRVALKS